MDTTLIAAIISALATIIAALGAALIQVKVSASRDREQLKRRAEINAAIGLRVLTEKDPEARAFLVENLELLGNVATLKKSRSERPKITIAPGEQTLALCVQKDNPRPAFNVLIKLANEGQQVATVDGLETILTGPEGESFRFVWHLFYGRQRDGLLHTLSSYIHPVAIQPNSSRLLGIQFIGPDLGLERLYAWPPGRYQCDMTGWTNRDPNRQPTNLSARFSIDISPQDIAQLKLWIGWKDADWARFPHPDYPDPDKAAGLPVRIVPD